MFNNRLRVCAGWLVLVSVILASADANSGAAGTDLVESQSKQVTLSDITLHYDLPSLRPSKDFPPPRIVSHIDLNGLAESRFVLHGYWDGPRHQLLSVTGTLHIWFDVRPWPASAASLRGCDAKARAFVDGKFSAENSFFERGYLKNKPVQAVSDFSIGGMKGLEFRSSFRRTSVGYVIPLNSQHHLYLVLQSVSNSDPSHGWSKLAEVAQEKFLRSLQLTGNLGDC